MLKYST